MYSSLKETWETKTMSSARKDNELLQYVSKWSKPRLCVFPLCALALLIISARFMGCVFRFIISAILPNIATTRCVFRFIFVLQKEHSRLALSLRGTSNIHESEIYWAETSTCFGKKIELTNNKTFIVLRRLVGARTSLDFDYVAGIKH